MCYVEITKPWSTATNDTCLLLPAAGEMLQMAEPFLEHNLHPTVIIRGYVRALEDAISIIDSLAFNIDTNKKEEMLKIVSSCIGTKFTSRFGRLIPVIHRIRQARCSAIQSLLGFCKWRRGWWG